MGAGLWRFFEGDWDVGEPARTFPVYGDFLGVRGMWVNFDCWWVGAGLWRFFEGDGDAGEPARTYPAHMFCLGKNILEFNLI